MQPWQEDKIRRERNFLIAVASMERVGQYADRLGVGLNVTNEHKHWRFFIGKRVAEFWPLSGTLVFDRQYSNATPGAETILEVLKTLRFYWALSIRVPLPKLVEPDGLDDYMRRFTANLLLPWQDRHRRSWNRDRELQTQV